MGCTLTLGLDDYEFEEPCQPGTERCRCSNNNCIAGLECRVPDVCVDPNSKPRACDEEFGVGTQCATCVCSRETGCQSQATACFNSDVVGFGTMCEGIVACARENGCVGPDCYALGCMTVIDQAAAMFQTEPGEACFDAPDSPCSAAEALQTCEQAQCADECL